MKVNLQTLIIVVLGIALISITVFSVNKEKEVLSKQEPKKVYVGYEDKEVLDNFSKKGAADAMIEVLNSIDKDTEGKERSIEDRMKSLDGGDLDLKDVINEKTISMLYLSEDFEEIKFNRQFTASALLTYRQLIKEITKSDKVESLVSPSILDEMVYLDNKMKTAYIPLDVFIGDNKGVAFEMKYVDGEWLFNPYTSMMSLIMIVNYESQLDKVMLNNKDKSS